MITSSKFTVLAFSLILASCTASPGQKDYEDESKSPTIQSVGGGGTSNQKLLNVPVTVEHGAFGLMATSASAWTVDLDSTCLSGYTATVTEANLDGIEVYKDDRNCLAKLTQFTAGGVTYAAANPGATDFTTWLANDTAIFSDAGGTNLIRVKVVSQLDTPITGTEAVAYVYSEILDGNADEVFSEAEVSDPHAITVDGQEAPLFSIVAASFTGMDDTSGAPEFTFKLECVDDPTSATPTSVAMGAGSGADTLCSENDLQDIEYKLVIDSYGGTLTISDAETIFGTAGSTVAIPADQYQDSATNEGFNTSTLDGPGPLGTPGNENMILILKAGISYTYFNVDVTTISQ